MKLSILIPTFNTDCRSLVEELHRQLPEDCEIIVGDDGSSQEDIKTANRLVIEGLSGVTFWESEWNRGRAGMRNQLIRRAQGTYVLIMDADAQVMSDNYLDTYLQQMPTDDVLCGGIRHPEMLPSPSVSLRWRYEKHCEPHLTPKIRNAHPYLSISTFNILLPRKVALSHPFDEGITQYGYEDTLLGYQLEKAGIGIRHIDNPLMHLGLDVNACYLQKTEEAMQTLYGIRDKIGNHSRLLRTYDRLHRLHLLPALRLTYRLTRGAVRHNLLGPRPSILLFQFYKLGYYTQIPLNES